MDHYNDYPDASTPTYLIGIDLGKKRDYTAIAAFHRRLVYSGRSERVEAGFDLYRGTTYREAPVFDSHYDLLYLNRWRGKNYREVVPEARRVIRELMQAGHRDYFERVGQSLQGSPDIRLLIDQTGVGEAVVNDVIRGAGLDCIGITITGGTATTNDGDDWRVPKRELVGCMEVVVENRRIHFPSTDDLPAVEALVAEMDNFTAKTNLQTGHDSYGAGADWRDGNHDDMVLAVAMAVWFGETGQAAGDYSDLDAYERLAFGSRV